MAGPGTEEDAPPRSADPVAPPRARMVPSRLPAARAQQRAATKRPIPVKVVHESKRWQRPYRRRLLITDVVVVAVAMVAAEMGRFGVATEAAPVIGSVLDYTGVSVLLALLWAGFLIVFRTRDLRILGAGAEEYRRIGDASLRLFGLVAIVAFTLRLDVARVTWPSPSRSASSGWSAAGGCGGSGWCAGAPRVATAPPWW